MAPKEAPLTLEQIIDTVCDERLATFTLAQQEALLQPLASLALHIQLTQSDLEVSEDAIESQGEKIVLLLEGLIMSTKLLGDCQKRVTELEAKVENNKERLSHISKWPIDGHERRLAKLEVKTGLDTEYEGMNRNSPVTPDRKAQIDKYPNLLK